MKESRWFVLLSLGIAIVYLTHLGFVPVHATADECRRALVPLEMYISGDYLTPTINGEIYLNKPPLFSWVVATSYHIFGSPSTFALRFPVVLSILLHGAIIFLIVRNHTDPIVAAMAALGFMTNGRTLTHDSMLGLLEHTLALFIYTGLMMIFILGEKKKYLWLFIISYFIAAIGFMIKGLPALVHHGIGLMIYFVLSKKTRLLFSWEHVAGIVVFLGMLALYYIPFLPANDLDAINVFSKLWNESAKRYEADGMGHLVHVFVDFPMDFIKHFLPWTLLIIVLIRKDIRHVVIRSRFVLFNALLFIFNVPIYWLAALKNPHYLYFMLPLLFTVIFHVWNQTAMSDWRRRGVEIIFLVTLAGAMLISLWLPFEKMVNQIPGLWMKSTVLAMAFLFLFIMYLKFSKHRLFVFTAGLILVRLALNWFVLPQRIEDQNVYQHHAIAVQQLVEEAPLYLMAEYPAGYYDGITYHLEKLRNEILTVNRKGDETAFYLVDDITLARHPNEILYQFPYVYADNHETYRKDMYLIRIEKSE